MGVMRSIDIPVFIVIDEQILSELSEILKDSNLYFRKSLVVHGEPPLDEIAEKVSSSLDSSVRIKVSQNTIDTVTKIEEMIEEVRPDVIIGVGGGKTLDPAKLASTRMQVGFISIPTVLSHDGISSPVAVIYYGKEAKSVGVRMPLGVIVDIEVIKKAPLRGVKAGIGDLLSNISAAEDWIFAEKKGKERIDPFALTLARTPALNFLKTDYNSLGDKMLIKDLAEGLIMSGIAMGIAGSSRPASGAEHLISHALDKILPEPRYHGEQVGIATIFTLYMHGKEEWVKVKEFYKKLEIAYTPEKLGITKDDFLKAVEIAPETRRGRFTILDIKGKEKEYISQVYDRVFG